MIPEPIFSIIVPVYNVEPYLKRCLQSIANQTFKNIEVIIVYDPSTDSSLKICQSFSESHSNFKLYFGQNNGTGSARNYGFNLAKGKYICYVDSDDWIENTMCADMLDAIEGSEVDFVNFGFDFVEINNTVKLTKKSFSETFLHAKDIFKAAMLDDGIYTVVWNKVYKRSFLVENQIFFPEVKEWEDILYSRKVAYYSTETSFVPKVYYHALIRNDSRSRTITSGFLKEGLSLLSLEYQFILKLPDGSRYENLFKAHFIKHISFFLVKAAFQVQSRLEYDKCFELINKSEYRNYIVSPEVLEILPKKTRIVISICKYPILLRFISVILKQVRISPY